MVNKLKKFFKAMGGRPNNAHSAHGGSVNTSAVHDPVKSPSASIASGTLDYGSVDAITFSSAEAQQHYRWGEMLSKIPKLVSEGTNPAVTAPTSDATNRPSQFDDLKQLQDLATLLEYMAAAETRTQVLKFYELEGGSPKSKRTAHNDAPDVTWEHRKLYRVCRRALLRCWKFILAQLNEKGDTLGYDRKNTYYKLVGLIAERPCFNLSENSGLSNASRNGTNKNGSGSGQVSSNTSWMPNPSDETLGGGREGDTSDEERDLYLYRCLLVGTFKYVVDNIGIIKHKKRGLMTLSETQLFSRVLAICFIRIPVLQRMMLNQLFRAYKHKTWVNVEKEKERTGHNPAPSSVPESPDPGRRRSSSRPFSGARFADTLSRWTEFEGHILSENERTGQGEARPLDANDDHSASHRTQYSSPTKKEIEQFRRRNPTLFLWSRFTPYLAPYADNEVFQTQDGTQNAWLERLSHDGEFFFCFMASYHQHVQHVAVNTPVWTAMPGYSLLIRIAMLVLKEACWFKWLYIRGTTDASPSAMMEGSKDGWYIPFEIRNIRGTKCVLDTVPQVARNKDILESCVFAMYECTNVLHPRMVSACLSRFEEWFCGAAQLVPESTGIGYSYRLPSTFNGQVLAIGLRIMISSDNFEILSRILDFFYNRLDYFDGDLRQVILKTIVQRHMFLFLHWNPAVRNKYHHILVYRIVRVNRFILDSPIDQLLVGRLALSSGDVLGNSNSPSRGYDVSEHVGATAATSYFGAHVKAYQPSSSEFHALRLEQALWRAFDACIATVCVSERNNAREGNRQYQNEMEAAKARAEAFEHLTRETAQTGMSSVNERLPGGRPMHELDYLLDELHRQPPYYLRYLPTDDVAMLMELQRLATGIKYPTELHSYAAVSLRNYTNILSEYYEHLHDYGVVEPPQIQYS